MPVKIEPVNQTRAESKANELGAEKAPALPLVARLSQDAPTAIAVAQHPEEEEDSIGESHARAAAKAVAKEEKGAAKAERKSARRAAKASLKHEMEMDDEDQDVVIEEVVGSGQKASEEEEEKEEVPEGVEARRERRRAEKAAKLERKAARQARRDRNAARRASRASQPIAVKSDDGASSSEDCDPTPVAAPRTASPPPSAPTGPRSPSVEIIDPKPATAGVDPKPLATSSSQPDLRHEQALSARYAPLRMYLPEDDKWFEYRPHAKRYEAEESWEVSRVCQWTPKEPSR